LVRAEHSLSRITRVCGARTALVAAAMIWLGSGTGVHSSPVNDGRTGLPIGAELDEDAPNNPRNPCRQWQAAAATAGVVSSGKWRCEPIERAIVDQHETVEYSVVTPNRQPSYGWVDTTIGFPVKWQAADGKVFVLKNILLQAQPASLFTIPSDYRKLDPRALLERVKHSDVWADSPK
jgi:hypothetical protein